MLDYAEILTEINWLAVAVATVAAFAIGAVWYGPLYSKKWQKEVGLTNKDVKNADMKKTFGGGLLITGLVTITMAGLLTALEITGFGESVLFGSLMGLFFGAMVVANSYLYAQRSKDLMLIDGGYIVLWFATAAGVLSFF